MDLRDRFAAHFAATLVDAFADDDQIARRAYDLAEAMLAERARRIDADEEGAIVFEPRRASVAAPSLAAVASELTEHHGALLDEPAPMFEPDLVRDDEYLDPSLLEPPYDPSWDLDAHLIVSPGGDSSRPSGPGLARTQPDQDEAHQERTA